MKISRLLIFAALVSAVGLAPRCATGVDPCDPNPCDHPPQATCLGSVAVIYPTQGNCSTFADQAECEYLPAETDCAEADLFCVNGQCLSDPCTPNPCTSPPAVACDKTEVVSYEAVGQCETSDELVDCTYGEAGRVDCSDTGEVCVAGGCEDSTSPCEPNPCTARPDDFCTNDVASMYLQDGSCTVDGTGYDCTYAPAELDCTTVNSECQDGACVTVADPCDPNPCTSAPPNTCALDVATQYNAVGACTVVGASYSCDYGPTPVNCALQSKVCDTGLCVDPADPCAVNPCTFPPANNCVSNTAYTYTSPGSCSDLGGGSFSCNYPAATTEDCTLSGEVCVGPVCGTATLGTLIISEYVEGLSYNKYLELYNASNNPVNLGSYRVIVYFNVAMTTKSTLVLDSVTLQPGQLYVIADDGHDLWTVPGPDQVFSSQFFNGNDAVVLETTDGTQIDIVGVLQSDIDYAKDTTYYRNAGVHTGVTTSSWVPSEWTELTPVETHQLGSHTP